MLASNRLVQSKKLYISARDRVTKIASGAKHLDDGALARGLFYVVLAVVIVTLILDYRNLVMQEIEQTPAALPELVPDTVLPFLAPDNPNLDDSQQTKRPAITTAPEILNTPMTIELKSGGELHMIGHIVPGTAQVFAEKVENIKEYINRIELDSPGGSVYDALEISNTIRENGWTTSVLDGKLCASSCPLIFVGGKERFAGEKSAIGVHQVFAPRNDTRPKGEVVSSTQQTTADIKRHLKLMGADPDLWLHALDTPPQQLYYFSPQEMKKYKLSTNK